MLDQRPGEILLANESLATIVYLGLETPDALSGVQARGQKMKVGCVSMYRSRRIRSPLLKMNV